MVRVSDFHDGYLTGVRLEKDGATIYLQRVDGVYFELSLAGLHGLQVEDMRQGNIIFDVEVIVGIRPPENLDFKRLFPPPHEDAADSHQEAYAEFIERQKERIESGEFSLLAITSSYGADLLAICRDVSCSPG